MQNMRSPIKFPASFPEPKKRWKSELTTASDLAGLFKDWLEFETQNGASNNTINAYQIGINIFLIS